MKRGVVILLAATLIRCSNSAAPAAGHMRTPPWQVSSAATVRDLAFDPKRNVVYVSQPDSVSVAVLSLTTKSYRTALTFPGEPGGLDLSPGGDSLFVAERYRPYITVLNLVTSERTLLAVKTFISYSGAPASVRVMGNNKALVTLTSGGIGFGGNLLDVDLVTGAVTNLAAITEFAPMCRSRDRSAALVVVDTNCCSLVETLVYDRGRDAITSDQGTVKAPYFFVSADSGGSRFLVAGTLFTKALTPVGSFAPSGATGPSVLAPDGRSAYFATATGVTRIAIPDRTVLETTTLGGAPYLLGISPDGLTLVAVAHGYLFVVDES